MWVGTEVRTISLQEFNGVIFQDDLPPPVCLLGEGRAIGGSRRDRKLPPAHRGSDDRLPLADAPLVIVRSSKLVSSSADGLCKYAKRQELLRNPDCKDSMRRFSTAIEREKFITRQPPSSRECLLNA